MLLIHPTFHFLRPQSAVRIMKPLIRPPVNFLHLTLYLFYPNQMHTFFFITYLFNVCPGLSVMVKALRYKSVATPSGDAWNFFYGS